MALNLYHNHSFKFKERVEKKNNINNNSECQVSHVRHMIKVIFTYRYPKICFVPFQNLQHADGEKKDTLSSPVSLT